MSALLRAFVVEDEWVARDHLVEMLEQSGLASVIGAAEHFDEAVHFFRTSDLNEIDVAFVDITLAGTSKTGLEIVEEFGSSTSAPLFVFATADPNFAVTAFELKAVDFLVKPLGTERLMRCLERVAALRPRQKPLAQHNRIVARRNRNLVFLELDEIWAFESSDRLTMVHSVRGRFDIDLSLTAVQLSFGKIFLRAHRNWLVSQLHVRELERDSGDAALLVGGTAQTPPLRIPVGRDRSHSLRSRLLETAFGLRKR
jgi:two-component system, LytTR family, response regulator LytT